MALALPDDGYILACDTEDQHIKKTEHYWQQAGVHHKIDVAIAPASHTLQNCIDNQQENSFDFAFIDADKENYLTYYELCYTLIKPGGVLVFDNALWGGAVADDSQSDANVNGIRNLLDTLHHDERIESSLIPVADGLALALKK